MIEATLEDSLNMHSKEQYMCCGDFYFEKKRFAIEIKRARRRQLSGNIVQVMLYLNLIITACSAGAGSGRISSEDGTDTRSDTQRTRVRDVKKEAPEATAEATAEQAQKVLAAGRAFEAGDLDGVAENLDAGWEFPAALLLRARLAAKLGDNESAVRLYDRLTDAEKEFEPTRVMELSRALAGAGRFDEAAGQLKSLERLSPALSKKQKIDHLDLQASWLSQAGDHLGAIECLQKALALADKGAHDKLKLHLATALVANGDLKAGEEILVGLAFQAGQAAVMRSALRELEAMGRSPAFSDAKQLERARRFVDFRAFKDAERVLEPLLASKDRGIAEEAKWLRAKVLFDKRNAYLQAIEALQPIVDEKGKYADKAEFLIARALSRLDQDKEAIEKYKKFARNKSHEDGDRARYLAARLEYYLGRHRSVCTSLEAMVGNGKGKQKKNRLTSSERRDAHFLAGMSFLLLDRPAQAAPHFDAASNGTSDENVLARNRYWFAVAHMLIRGASRGPELLREICRRDPTSWYARLSAERLLRAGANASDCDLLGIHGSNLSMQGKPLTQLSPLAGFYASAGLYREAAVVLFAEEQRSPERAETRDWVLAYLALDAPHYAIKRASIGLSWPPSADEYWRVMAAYPSPHRELVEKVEEKHGLLQGLVYAIARKESLFDPRAVSHVGAMGMMQMMPATYEHNRKKAGLPELPAGEIPGPEASIQAAGYELEHLLEKYDGSYPLAIMGYNAGSKAVDRWLYRSGDLPLDVFVEKAGFSQTRNYIKLVHRNLVRYRVLADAPEPKLPSALPRSQADKQ